MTKSGVRRRSGVRVFHLSCSFRISPALSYRIKSHTFSLLPSTTTTSSCSSCYNYGDPSSAFPDQPKQLSADLVKAAKQFDALVASLPLSQGGEEAQLKRIAQLQVENDVIGQQLPKQLEAAEKELKQVQELFGLAADNCLNLKKPE
ncbi:hypothetical protein Rs2_03485 [Raphanus sativus]|nr:hypothetical protein Rs2_03485 [Raphanus sativus]